MKNHTYIFLIVLAILSLGFQTVSAQSKTYQKAVEAYTQERFYDATNLLKAAYDEENTRQVKTEINFMLGECYRKMGKYKDAEDHYMRAIKMRYNDPIATYYLAEMLKAQGRYDEAINEYNNYRVQAPSDKRSDVGIESCNTAKKWLEMRTRYAIENMEVINSQWNDFNPIIVKRGGGEIVFTSTREEAMGKDKDGWTGESFSDLFYTEQDRKSRRDKSLTPVWSTPVPLDESINTEANEGAAAMNARINTMYYTVCDVQKDRNLTCAIYKARKQGPSWGLKEKLPLASDSVLVLHPALSPDEKIIYFVSDMDGGYGGTDIYMAEYDKRKRAYTTPVNLGPEINSPGNEMFPYIGPDEKLYFSSNGHVGMGGFDLFVSENRDGQWLKPQNMMPPFNSSADDITLIWMDEKCREGFFASDREGGKGEDDIYRVFMKPLELSITGVVTDAKTGAVVQQCEVTLTASNGKMVSTFTDVLGVYTFEKNQVAEDVNYTISFKKEGYLNKNASTTTVGIPLQAFEETPTGFAYKISLSKEIDPIRKPIELPTIEFDFGSADLRLEAKDALDQLLETLEDNPEVIIELRAHTDYRGSDQANQELSQRRAQSCVDYLLSKGVDSLRMKAVGMGESEPFVLEKAIPPFKKGDVLTPEYIDQLAAEAQREMAHQLNRRVDFKVVSSDYKPFGKGFDLPKDTTATESTEDKEQ